MDIILDGKRYSRGNRGYSDSVTTTNRCVPRCCPDLFVYYLLVLLDYLFSKLFVHCYNGTDIDNL